jgi:hypothetical protein
VQLGGYLLVTFRKSDKQVNVAVDSEGVRIVGSSDFLHCPVFYREQLFRNRYVRFRPQVGDTYIAVSFRRSKPQPLEELLQYNYSNI